MEQRLSTERPPKERIQQLEYEVNEKKQPDKILGRGAYGEVFKGTLTDQHGKPRSSVAIKRVLIGNNDEREKYALDRLMNHPNVIRLFHTEEDSSFRYYAMELCDASMDCIFLKDDDKKKYRGPLPSDPVVLLQIASGLHYIHSKELVHQDIKPENILILVTGKDSAVMKLADFGLSRTVNKRGTYTSSGVKGTVIWMAKEAQKGTNKRGTIKSDIFAAGCVFFYYLTKGRHPFGDKNAEILRNMRRWKPNLSALQQDEKNCFACDIIQGMIVKKPTDRTELTKVINSIKEHIPVPRVLDEEETLLASAPDDVNPRVDADDQIVDWSLDTPSPLVSVEPSPSPNADEKPTERIELKDDIDCINAPETMLHMQPVLHEEETLLAPSYLVNSRVDNLVVDWLIKVVDTASLVAVIVISLLIFTMIFGIYYSESSGTTSQPKLHWLLQHEMIDDSSFTQQVRDLINSGVDINAKDHAGRTALYILCSSADRYDNRTNFIDVARLLVNPDEGDALHQIIKTYRGSHLFEIINRFYFNRTYSLEETVTLLMKNGMELNSTKDRYGANLLHLLPSLNYKQEKLFKTVKDLVHHGIDVKALDVYKKTALHRFCMGYNSTDLIDIVKLLIDSGIDSNLKDVDGKDALYWLYIKYAGDNIMEIMNVMSNANSPASTEDANNNEGWNSVFYQICESHSLNINIFNMVEQMVAEGKLNVTTKEGRWALQRCFLTSNSYSELVTIHGKDEVNNFNQKFVNWSVGKWELEQARMMIEKGTIEKLNAVDQNGYNLLHIIAMNRHSDHKRLNFIFTMLVERGINVNAIDRDGNNALHLLARGQRENPSWMEDMFKVLLDHGIEVNVFNHEGDNVLHLLAKNRNIDPSWLVDLMSLLLQERMDVCKNVFLVIPQKLVCHRDARYRGIDATAKDSDGNNALHLLLETRDSRTLSPSVLQTVKELLVSHGLDLDDKNGRSCREILSKLG